MTHNAASPGQGRKQQGQKWQYIGWFAGDPFDQSTVFSWTGLVTASSKTEAYDKAAIELEKFRKDRETNRLEVFDFLNWFVREA